MQMENTIFLTILMYVMMKSFVLALSMVVSLALSGCGNDVSEETPATSIVSETENSTSNQTVENEINENAATEEESKAEEERQKVEEERKAEEERQKAEEEKKAEEERKKAEEEARKKAEKEKNSFSMMYYLAITLKIFEHLRIIDWSYPMTKNVITDLR